MRSRITRLSRARIVALALGVGALGSLAAAPAAFAAGAGPKPPVVGINCQQDGKISGAGSTFQANAINDALTYGFQQDVCGPQPTASNLNAAYAGVDPSDFTFGTPAITVNGMAAYNYSLAGTAAKNGSGAGITRMECRTDFFGGTDLPYNNSQLTAMDGAEVTGSGCSSLNTAAVPAPYGPAATTTDATANVMSFPVAAGAVAIAVNLNGVCTTVPTGTTINLTDNELEKIWEGTITTWNDPDLVLTNPILGTDGCTGPIQRVVRFDNSGTTSILMNTLYGIDLLRGSSGDDMCGTDASTGSPALTDFNWYVIGTDQPPATSGGNQQNWPAAVTGSTPNCADPNVTGTPAAPNVISSTGNNGSPALISLLDTTNGGIGYAETGLWPNPLPAGVSFVNLETFNTENAQTGTAAQKLANDNPVADAAGDPVFIGPGAAGAQSNCKLPSSVPTGASANAAVGLASPNWSNQGTTVGGVPPITPGAQDIAWTPEAAGYPACGLTFDMVYAGVNNETGEATPVTGASLTVAGPLQGVTNDQLRTLYSYWTYAFSPLGQSAAYLPKQTLDALPATWLTQLTQGFQNNY